MDILGISSLIVSVGGVSLALWQNHKTKKAAAAAREAAADAIRQVRVVHGVATIQDICGRSRDLLHLMRARSLSAAATGAFELRDALARFQASSGTDALINAATWRKTISTVTLIHERLESAALTQRLDVRELESAIHDIARVHSELSAIAAQAITDGGSRGNP